MAFEGKFTELVNGDVHFNLESTNEPTDLVEYVNQYCKDKCNTEWDIDNPPECDCPYSRLYYAMTLLAIHEHDDIEKYQSKGEKMKQIINIEIEQDISNLEGADEEFLDKVNRITERDIKKLLKRNIVHIVGGLDIKINAKIN